MDFHVELQKKIQLVEKALDTHLLQADVYPQEIHQAMRYSIFAGGKRIRPILALSTAEVIGGNIETLLPAACALECIHTYSLIHDDLPSMDDDDYRRGQPTCHKKFGEAMALLAGDALLTKAFELLSQTIISHHINPVIGIQVIQEIAKASGTLGLIGGQVVDILSHQHIDTNTLKYIHRNKTGALLRVSARLGAILSQATPEKLDKLTSYAEYLGLSFQIADDILDIIGDQGKLGKPLHSDSKNQKATYPALYGLEKAKFFAEEYKDKALEQLASFGPEADFLRQLVCFVVTRDY